MNLGKVGFDPGHYSGANAGPGTYREGDLMLKLGNMLHSTYKVFTTRTDGNDITLLKRAKLAKEAGCDTIISIHTNAPEEAKGILVFYSMHRPQDKDMAEYIGQELSKATGIPFRAAKTRPSTTYPTQDYYGMIRHPYNLGMRGFIVEHGSHWEMAVDTDKKLEAIVRCYGRIIGKEEPAVYKVIGGSKIHPTVKMGSKGQDVIILQKELNAASFNCGVVDGDFGKKTDKAVRGFQQACGLVSDGIVGKMTWTALLQVHVVELSPSSLRAQLVSNSGIEIGKVVSNFINANFFDGIKTIGWLASEGKILAERNQHEKWGGLYDKPKGTFIIYKDGSVDVGFKTDAQMDDARDLIQFCCQGFNLFPIDLKKEGFSMSEVGRPCNSLMLGWNGSKVIIAVRQGTNAYRAAETMLELGCSKAIRLDSGGSCNLWVDGKAIFKTSRELTNIVCW